MWSNVQERFLRWTKMEGKSIKRHEDGNAEGSPWAMVGWSRTGEKKNYIVTASVPRCRSSDQCRAVCSSPPCSSEAPLGWREGLNLGLLHCKQILYHLSQGNEKPLYTYIDIDICVYTCCDSWGRKESDTTERLIYLYIHITSMFKLIYSVSKKFASYRCHFLISRWLIILISIW